MNIRIKVAIFFLLVTVAAAPELFSRDRIFLENLEFNGRSYSLEAAFSPGQADLLLRGKTSANLSTGMRGENILLGVRCTEENFYVFWLNYRHKVIRLAYYDHRRQRCRVLKLDGFRFFALPEIVEENGDLRALVFLGNQTGNDDVFHYDLEAETLTPLTRTPFSEKGFSLRKNAEGIEIETRSLWAQYRYRFDPRLRRSDLLEEKPLRSRQKKASIAPNPEYCNTYIGFGDSITWGQIEAVQRIDLCYLTQMRDIYLPLIYGPAQFVNLGIPAQTTYDGTLRVNQDLNANPGFYFLLMLGVNDVWKREFSLASSLENLEFIVDAALARNMRVIVSTLTPRKDFPHVLHQYYWDQLYSLSAGILALAAEKGTASIDTLTAFMNTNPPNGWKDLLEDPGTVIVDEEEVQVKGNHPNAAGHSLIASLFAATLAKFPPLAPQNITVMNHQDRQQKTAFWDANYESDFSHFHIEFGFQPQDLRYSLDTTTSYRTFNLFPFLPQFYFRIQTVDRGNQQSAFSTLETTAASSATQPNRKK
ncbi:MAG: SGNH/GDSL hydrolase family protein [Candidatus Aminicenantes bacterium]|nr:SGNH/GDSL hydrolase family protein [Candidatus Aminicenantes bacterium]